MEGRWCFVICLVIFGFGYVCCDDPPAEAETATTPASAEGAQPSAAPDSAAATAASAEGAQPGASPAPNNAASTNPILKGFQELQDAAKQQISNFQKLIPTLPSPGGLFGQ